MSASGHELPDSDTDTDGGRSILSTTAVVHLVGLAARQAAGVADLAAPPAVAIDDERHLASVTVRVVVEYGAGLHSLADDVRAAVAGSLGEMTGLAAAVVDVVVEDVRSPGTQTR